jgi:hypothetical protein
LNEEPLFEELFHVRTDRDETQNLARRTEHASRLGDLRKRREEWLSALAKWTPECDWRSLEPSPQSMAN